MKGGKGTGKMGKRYWQTGRKVVCNQIRPPALINWGERPYISERTALHLRATAEF